MKTLEDNMKAKNIEQENYSEIKINNLLKGNKRIVTFVGVSKSGTSFILNNIAKHLSNIGINVAILDATQNRSAYYLYTKNEEILKKIANSSIDNLIQGEAKGICVNDNLTVYTGYLTKNEHIQMVEPILETLLKNHTVILIDCDFDTPTDYFKYSEQIYMVQTIDILTIQQFTEFLSELKNKGLLQESKLRIIINKFIGLEGIAEKEIIGAMSFYNDPSTSYMKELFNKNTVKYITIPFMKEIYEKYLGAIVKNDINLEGYPYNFTRILSELSDEINPSAANENIE